MIITFYSFKGGVGRSMALANIAELLYKQGLRVLMVDFDLEAPGLERYFDVSGAAVKSAEMAGRRGVIDMLMSFTELRSFRPQIPPRGTPEGANEPFPYSVEPIENFITPIYPDNGHGALSLLPAGNRSDSTYADYSRRVLDFDWKDFYVNHDGDAYFDWFRGRIENDWDVTLIDSRTGVTEMGGICTHHLGDVVVSFVATNRQNLDGVRMMAGSLRNPQLIERRKRPLHLLFIPARVELSEEDKYDDFAAQFISELGPLFPAQFHFQPDPFLEFRLQYVPAYAYMERVAVRERERQSKADLIAAYERIASRLSQLADPDARLAQVFSVTPVERLARTANDLYEEMPPAEQAAVREVFSRLTFIDEEGAVIAQKVGPDEIAAVSEPVIRKLSDARIIERSTSVVLTEPALAGAWPRLREWLEQDKWFLKWRAGLATLGKSWLLAKRSSRYLLEFQQLRRALKWQNIFPGRLNPIEKEYISRSKRRAVWQLTGIAVAAVLVSLTTIAWWKNSELKSEASNSISVVQKASAEHAPPDKMLAALDTLRDSYTRLNEYQITPPWWNQFPVVADKHLYDEVGRIYLDSINRVLVIPTEQEIASRLKELPNGVMSDADAYNALKAYLMMTTNPEKSSYEFVGLVVPAYLPADWSDVASKTRDHFEHYSIGIRSAPASASDPDAVANARKYLLQRNSVDRIYASLLQSAQANDPSQILSRLNLKALTSPPVLVTGQEVRPRFSKSTWQYMKSAIEKLTPNTDDVWVLGTEATDPEKLKPELMSRFTNDYIHAWLDYLQAARIATFDSAADAAAKLKVLSDSHSPLLAFLCTVSQATRGDGIGADIELAFQPVHAVVGPDCADQLLGPTNKQYIDALAGLQAALQHDSASFLRSYESARVAANSIVSRFSVKAPAAEPVKRLLEEPIVLASAPLGSKKNRR